MPLTNAMKTLVANQMSSVRMALFTEAPTSTGGGTEVTGGSYARVTVAMTAAPADPGLVSNAAAASFNALPECDVVAVGLFNSSGTSLLYWATLTTPRHFDAGDSTTLAAGQFTVQIA